MKRSRLLFWGVGEGISIWIQFRWGSQMTPNLWGLSFPAIEINTKGLEEAILHEEL